jgi:general secretion pathway protein A
MYEAFYGLRAKPFSLYPDPQFLYWAGSHSLAFATLEYGVVNHAGFTVITGEIGAGKTTLIRHLLNKLPGNITVGLASNIVGRQDDLLRWLLMVFKQDFEGGSYVGLYRKFEDFLIKQHAENKRTVLIIDEAQNLGVEALEELRTTSNVNHDGHELLQIILSGQPQLKALLRRPELIQFAQRVSSDFHLGLLSFEEVPAYIDHRLAIAGATRQIFSDEICSLIAKVTKGVPRVINMLCETCLTYGFASEAQIIRPQILLSVINDKDKFGALKSTLVHWKGLASDNIVG